ncbi:MAG TPA: BMP family protein [Roseiflexaceae bacterium]|jgi:basic membrane lipoprotein Med (substrate-binding protein (PBP1-ABC) superfamily)|nr:BMP family protein [Roseiflexaceae bacterium]
MQQHNHWQRYFILFTSVFTALLLAACNAPATQSTNTSADTSAKVRVAMLMIGSAADGGWNSSAAAGLRQLRDTYGVETEYKELTPHPDWNTVTPPDWLEAIDTYANKGYPLIFLHGRYFDKAIGEVAPKYPNTRFVLTGGNANGPNYASVTLKNEEGGYLLGVLAGLMTKSNVIGTIAGLQMRPILATVEGFKSGVRAVNPHARIIDRVLANPTANTGMNSTNGANVEAEELITQGADIIFAHATSANVGIITIAKQHNVHVVNYATDLSSIAPETVLANGIQFVPSTMMHMFETFKDGKFEGKIYSMGLTEDAIRLSPLRENLIPDDIQKKVDQARQDLISGKVTMEIER